MKEAKLRLEALIKTLDREDAFERNLSRELSDIAKNLADATLTDEGNKPTAWVGLTSAEQAAAWYGQSGHHPEYPPARQRDYARAIEAKLREKNEGAA